MSKEQSQLIKGIAILMMIFLHLFNNLENLDLCSCFFFMEDIPLLYLLTDYVNPVPIFLILSGYGLFQSWVQGDKNKWGRLLKLLLHFWIILFFFVFLGSFIRPEQYPGDISKIFINFSTFGSSYNSELWFLFPYICIYLIAPIIFKFYRKLHWILILAIGLLSYIGGIFILTRILPNYTTFGSYLYPFCYIFMFLLNFSLGMLAARERWFEMIIKKSDFISKINKISLILISICSIIAINFFTKYNFFYSFFICSVLLLIPYAGWIKQILIELGKQSMDIWMIHSWFCYHLFHDFIYSLKYPLLIFLTLTAISYILAIGFKRIIDPIEYFLRSRKKVQPKPFI